MPDIIIKTCLFNNSTPQLTQVLATFRSLCVVTTNTGTKARNFTMYLLSMCSRRMVVRSRAFMTTPLTPAAAVRAEAVIGPAMKTRLNSELLQANMGISSWRLACRSLESDLDKILMSNSATSEPFDFCMSFFLFK